jgi:uncharacterized membrane protein
MSQQVVLDSGVEDAKQFARIMYVVHALTFFFSLGLLSVVPLIVNYIKRPDTAGTIVYSHHTWMINSFWIYLIGNALAWLLVFTFFGIPLAVILFGIMWLWMAYRLIRGFMDLNNNRPMSA